MWGWITALVEGLIKPLLTWWSTYSQGRGDAINKGLKESLQKQQELHDALDKIRMAPSRIERDILIDEWLRRGARGSETPTKSSDTGEAAPPGRNVSNN